MLKTIRGDRDGMPPALVLWHIERLPDTSLTTAYQLGGEEHFGWGYDRHLAASTFDALQQNTESTGFYEKPPKLSRWPRPKTRGGEGDEPKKRTTVRDLFNKFTTK